MKRVLTAILAAASLCALGAGKPAGAQETKLLFADVVPPGSVIDAKVVQPWCRRSTPKARTSWRCR